MIGVIEMIELTEAEVESLIDWIEIHFIQDLKEDEDADSLEWLANMMSIYRKCQKAIEEEKKNV